MHAISWNERRDEGDHHMRNSGDPDDLHVIRRSQFEATSEIVQEG